METLDFEYLLGDHVLSGCDTDGIINYDEWCSANVIDFILDGKILSAIENPEDSYRSSLDNICLNRDGAVVKNTFPDCFVTGIKSDDIDEDIIRLIDKTTGKAVIAVGTDNCDDYYPYFVGEFDPTNMAINQI